MLAKSVLTCLLFWAATTCVAVAADGDALPTGDEIPAGVTYKDAMLVLIAEDGVAALVFPANAEEADGSLQYSFRYESRDGKTKTSGKGTVSELRKPGTDREVERNPDGTIAGEPLISAGPIKLQWSAGTNESGFVYYTPEKLKVVVAHASGFAARTDFSPFGDRSEQPALDLRRFMK